MKQIAFNLETLQFETWIYYCNRNLLLSKGKDNINFSLQPARLTCWQKHTAVFHKHRSLFTLLIIILLPLIKFFNSLDPGQPGVGVLMSWRWICNDWTYCFVALKLIKAESLIQEYFSKFSKFCINVITKSCSSKAQRIAITLLAKQYHSKQPFPSC